MSEVESQATRLSGLLARCALRDQQAFAALYRESAPKLFGVALRILRRNDWAEEVLQESYVNIWNHAGDYAAAKSAPFTWMTSIVRNRALDWLRRPQLESGGEEYEIAVEAWSDGSDGPLELAVAASSAAALARCMRTLDQHQRQSIALAFYHGLTHSELAAHLRQPLGTVKTWVRRGMEKLRTCLESP